MNVPGIQSALRDRELDAWVLWDFRGSNPVFWEVLAMRAPGTSRRAVLVIPVDGEPELVCSALDAPLLEGLPLVQYRGREEFVALLEERIRGRVAMEYSPRNAL